MYLYTVYEALLEALNPVEVEEPLKWSFETTPNPDKQWQADVPDQLHEGNWRHEVVSTRIG